MQQQTASEDDNKTSAPSKQKKWLDASPHGLPDCGNFSSLSGSNIHFEDSIQTPESVSFTPSSSYSDEDNTFSTETRLSLAHLALQYHELSDSYRICFTRLQNALQENDILTQENARLRIANGDLIKRLDVVSMCAPLADLSQVHSLINHFGGLNICGGGFSRQLMAEASSMSPTSVLGLEESPLDKRNIERVALPKSISIRSSGFLKVNQGNGAGASSSRSYRHRPAKPANVGSVYVPSGTKEHEALELEVYNQGMFKTELCNKWQETGACPYSDNCQFAHGIGELRPVIRHPRYKTEVCRMVLAGDICPYGHRCHFRHALTDQDRYVGPM